VLAPANFYRLACVSAGLDKAVDLALAIENPQPDLDVGERVSALAAPDGERIHFDVELSGCFCGGNQIVEHSESSIRVVLSFSTELRLAVRREPR